MYGVTIEQAIIVVVSIFAIGYITVKYLVPILIHIFVFVMVYVIGLSIIEGLVAFKEESDYQYERYIKKEYKMFKLNKQLGLIPKDEHFEWNDSIEEQIVSNSFMFVMESGYYR